MKIEASGELQTQAHEHACIHTRVQIYAYIYIRKFKINNKAKISEFWNLSTNVTQENVQLRSQIMSEPSSQGYST